MQPAEAPMNILDMRTAAGQATALLRSLAHEDRLLLLCQLTEAEHSVSELEEKLDIHQPSLSQQLGILRREGLVATRREGRHIFYRVANDRALLLLQQLYQIFCNPASDTTLAGDTQ